MHRTEFASSPDSAASDAVVDSRWAPLIPAEQWTVFTAGTDAIEAGGVSLLLGGALALAAYTGHWRNTKDVDVIVRARDAQAAVGALRSAGFEDYFDREAYDRSWIFRGFRDGVIFDVIWDLPNHRVQIDDPWFDRSRVLRLHDRTFRVVPAEELVRVKLYVMQRSRCDWVDVLNVLASTVHEINWRWLVSRMGRDLPLLHSVLALFNWMCAGRAHELPAWLREQFALPAIESNDIREMEERRARLLDSRPWFAPHQPLDRPMQL